MNTFRFTVLLFVLAVAASFAEETNTLPTTITVDGIIYSNVTWRGVTPATVSILHKTGVASIPLEKLPPELQKRFSYNPKKAADYRAAERSAEATRQEARRKQLAAQEKEARSKPGSIEYLDWRNGFRDWKFGQSIDEFDGMILREKRGRNARYLRQHDSMLAGGDLSSLYYTFTEGKFSMVTGKFVDAINCKIGVKSLIEAYGKPTDFAELDDVLGRKYDASANWQGKKAIATCSCNSRQGDYSFTIWSTEIGSTTTTPDTPDF